MKKLSLLCAALALLGACGKQTETKLDPGPKFMLDSIEIGLSANEKTVISLKRDDPQSGPQIQVHMDSIEGITAVDKTLYCGTVAISGHKKTGGGVSMFNFRLAEEEFPGLNLLPQRPSCKLSVVTTNNLGSTNTKIMGLVLNFDKAPPVQIRKLVLRPGIYETLTAAEVPIETYVITNVLPYPAKFLIFGKTTTIVNGRYTFRHPSSPNPKDSEAFTLESLELAPSRIQVSGDVVNASVSSPREGQVTVKARGTASVTLYAILPDYLRGSRMIPSANTQPLTGVFAGLYVRSVSRSPGLAMARDFEITTDDQQQPAFWEFKTEEPVAPVRTRPPEPTSFLL